LQLIIDQVMKDSSCHNPKMATCCQEVHRLEDKFDGLKLNHIPRRDNEAADTLAKMASDQEPVPPGVFASDQLKPSVHYMESEGVSADPPALGIGADPLPLRADSEPAPDVFVLVEVDEGPAAESDPQAHWRTPYLNYLLREMLPTNKTEVRCLASCAKSFFIINVDLYKKSCTKILQRCIPTEQGRKLLEDIHGRACRHHVGTRTLVRKAFRLGFY
jgi:hypothetical protein